MKHTFGILRKAEAEPREFRDDYATISSVEYLLEVIGMQFKTDIDGLEDAKGCFRCIKTGHGVKRLKLTVIGDEAFVN